MGCISPTVVRKGSAAFLAPCGRCSQCVASKVSAYTFFIQKELQSPLYRASGSSFVCLTYSNKTLPVSSAGYMTLVKDDLQRFFKRFRISLQRAGYDVPIKHLSCGEYGETDGRPHYHSCVLGISPALCEQYVRKSWTNGYGGLIDVKPLSLGAVGYVCKYLSKSHPYGKVLEEYQRREAIPPFVLTSKGLGVDWIRRNLQTIINNKFCYKDVQSGEMRLFPHKIRDYVEALTGVDPRPYVNEYIKTIDYTGFQTLDDFNSFRDYHHAREEYLKSVQSGKPAYQLSHCRLPPLMRSKTSTDYHSLVDEIIYPDKVPF